VAPKYGENEQKMAKNPFLAVLNPCNIRLSTNITVAAFLEGAWSDLSYFLK